MKTRIEGGAACLLAKIVQNTEQSGDFRLKELQTARVVEEVNIAPDDALLLVLGLFVLEDVLNKKKTNRQFIYCGQEIINYEFRTKLK